jgi:hypothetical protein
MSRHADIVTTDARVLTLLDEGAPVPRRLPS